MSFGRAAFKPEVLRTPHTRCLWADLFPVVAGSFLPPIYSRLPPEWMNHNFRTVLLQVFVLNLKFH